MDLLRGEERDAPVGQESLSPLHDLERWEVRPLPPLPYPLLFVSLPTLPRPRHPIVLSFLVTRLDEKTEGVPRLAFRLAFCPSCLRNPLLREPDLTRLFEPS